MGILCSDVLAPATARVAGRYEGAYCAVEPAVALNASGSGHALYVGTIGDRALTDAIVSWLVDTTGVGSSPPTPDGVEAVSRWKDGQQFLFLMNHAAEEQTIEAPATELISGKSVGGEMTLEPYGVAALSTEL